LTPRNQAHSIKLIKRERWAKIFRASSHLEAGPIPLEADCTKSSRCDLLKKIIFYKIIFFLQKSDISPKAKDWPSIFNAPNSMSSGHVGSCLF
jgi:hypothetical protein